MSTLDHVLIRRALVSVSDKSGLVPLCQALHARGTEILSTGGTAVLLRNEGIPAKDVSEHTGFPEMLDGRVKTLHPKIHGGLLGRRDLQAHEDAMRAHDIAPIDLVVVNLYPFESVAKKLDAPLHELIENIDIGGPSMLRSAAKNHDAVCVLTDPSDYDAARLAIESTGGTTLEFRRRMALKVYQRTASYDAAIALTLERAMARGLDDDDAKNAARGLGHFFARTGMRGEELRYGENPHQHAAVYATKTDALDLAGAIPLQGKALSYNNLLDAEAALFTLRFLVDGAPGTGAAIIKHGTPCGAARRESSALAWKAALAGDPVSAFGGIVAFSHPVDVETAIAMGDVFLEVVIAPSFTDEARAVFAKKKNLRLLAVENLASAPLPSHTIRSIPGGVLVQEHDRPFANIRAAKVVTKRAPTDDEWKALDVAFRMCAAVRSNAITLVRDEMLLGAGGGQTSRVDAARLAVEKARAHGHAIAGAALGSDAFFPFADGLLVGVDAGVRAVVQPGGSKNDPEVIAAADAHGVTMVFTDERHFRH
jgi:phosphoribosylaminoimidazolecarboxamide formyltransferase/IMP cyclohydrolase